MVRDTSGEQRSGKNEGLSSLPERFRKPGGDARSAANEQPEQAGAAGEAPAISAATPADASLVDRHSTFDGRFETAHDMRIEGSVSGEIVCRGALYIEREAIAKVKVEAREIYVYGQLEGDVECSEKMELAETATVSGTIKTGTLVVHEGAVLNGTIETGDGEGESGTRRRRSNRRASRADEAEPTEARPPSFALDAAEGQATSPEHS